MLDLSAARRRVLGYVAASLTAFALVSCGGGDFTEAPTPARFSTTTVVGASISDTGNTCRFIPNNAGCPPSPPYAAGRFSDGSLWIESVAANFGATVSPSLNGGSNFAFAGARTGSIEKALTDYAAQQTAAGNPLDLSAVVAAAKVATPPTVPAMNSPLGSTPAQIDALLARFNYQIAPQALVVVDGTTVGNNIADALTLSNPAVTPTISAQQRAAIPTAIVTGAVTDVVTIINRLYAAGTRNIMVLNSPDIGRTPSVQAAAAAAAAAVGGGEAGQAAAAAVIGGARAMSVGIPGVSPGFNGGLAQQLAGLGALLTGVSLTLLDVASIEAEIVANPAQFQMTNVTAPCFVSVPAVSVCTTPSAYFYWDGFHPTFATGQVVASRAISLLASP